MPAIYTPHGKILNILHMSNNFSNCRFFSQAILDHGIYR